MNDIKYPALFLNDGRIEIFTNKDSELLSTWLSYKEGNLLNLLIYDMTGNCFNTSEVILSREPTWIGKFFNFVWNPFIHVKFQFEKTKRKPNLEKLKSKTKSIIKCDDDVYTQFMEKEEIFEIIDNAKTTKELILGLQKILKTGY